MGNGAILLGHNHPEVHEAVAGGLECGLTCGIESAAISLGHDDAMIDELGSIFEHGMEAAAKALAS
jgi:glutamate-1-semialdehyde aminotransferase